MVSEQSSILLFVMVTMKYDISLLDHKSKFSFWHVEIQAMLAQMNLDDMMSRFDKMPLNLVYGGETTKGSKCPFTNTQYSLRWFGGENCSYIIVKIRAIMHDKKPNQQIAIEAVSLLLLYDKKYIIGRSSSYF